MADGGAVKQFTEEVEQAAKEVGEEVKDSVGEAIEQGVQSVVGTKITPAQMQQKQVQDQKDLQETRRKLRWYQDLSLSQKRVREEEKQKQLQKNQQEDQERSDEITQAQQKKAIISPAKKSPAVPGQASEPEEVARTKQEIGKGHGIGG